MKKTKLTTIAIMFASATALVAIPDTAAAHGSRGPQDPTRHMTSKASKKADLYTHRKHKACGKLILPTAGCPTPARDPVGSTRPSLPTEAKQPLDKTRQPGPESANRPADAPALQVAAPARVVAVSNGVTNATLNLGNGLTVSSIGNGAISVSNGTNAVTLAGGSVTLHGAPAVTPGAGVQVVRLSNDDYSVAARPAAAAPSSKVPPGVTFADDAKFVGRQLFNVTVAGPAVSASGVIGLPVAATVGVIEGHPVKTLGKYVDVFGHELGSVFD